MFGIKSSVRQRSTEEFANKKKKKKKKYENETTEQNRTIAAAAYMFDARWLSGWRACNNRSAESQT